MAHLAANHAALRALGKELKVPVLDLHSYLSSQFESGTLWWDVLHLSSLGHALAAQWLAPQLERYYRPWCAPLVR